MDVTIIVALIGVATTVFSFIFGRQSEKQKQSLTIRAQMLIPIEEWLKGAEKMNGILANTISTIAHDFAAPVMYDMDQRKSASSFMSENTNVVMGILSSKSLQTFRTKKLASELEKTIQQIDHIIKFQLLPTEYEIVERANNGKLTQEFMMNAGYIKLNNDKLMQRAYSLVAKIKTSLT